MQNVNVLRTKFAFTIVCFVFAALLLFLRAVPSDTLEEAFTFGEGKIASAIRQIHEAPWMRGILLQAVVSWFLVGGVYGFGIWLHGRCPWMKRLVRIVLLKDRITWKSECGWFCLSVALLFLFYHPLLLHPNLHPDHISVIHAWRTLSLHENLYLVSIDHIAPLLRIKVGLLDSLSGESPLTSSTLQLFQLSGLIYISSLLLAHFGIARLWRFLQILLASSFCLWGEYAVNFLSITAYTDILSLALFSVLSLRIWFSTGKRRWLLACYVCSIIAPLILIKGLYVPLATLAYFVAHSVIQSRKQCHGNIKAWKGKVLVGVGFAVLFAGLLALNVYGVRYYSAETGYVAARGTIALSIWGPALVKNFVGSFFLSLTMPVGQDWLVAYGLIDIALGLFAVLLAYLVTKSFSRSSALNRLHIAYLFALALGLAFMPAFGRGLPYREMYWVLPAKYLGDGIVCAVALVFFCFHRMAVSIRSKAQRHRMTQYLLFAAVLMTSIQVASSSIGAKGEKYLSGGQFHYLARIVEKNDREEAFFRKFHSMIRELDVENITLPDLSPAYTAASDLNYPIHLSMYTPMLQPEGYRITFIHNDPSPSPPFIRIGSIPVDNILSAVSPEFIQRLREDPWLQSLYFAPIPLSASSADQGSEANRDAAETFDLYKRSRIPDPGTRHILNFRLPPKPDNQQDYSLVLILDTPLLQVPVRHPVRLHGEGDIFHLHIDLRASNAWLLSDAITSVRLEWITEFE